MRVKVSEGRCSNYRAATHPRPQAKARADLTLALVQVVEQN